MLQTVLYLNRFLSAMEHKDLAQVLKECLKNARRGQWDAFVEMAQPIVASGVIRTLSRFLKPDRDLVDDLVQDTFVKLCASDFRVLRSFRAEDTLSKPKVRYRIPLGAARYIPDGSTIYELSRSHVEWRPGFHVEPACKVSLSQAHTSAG